MMKRMQSAGGGGTIAGPENTRYGRGPFFDDDDGSGDGGGTVTLTAAQAREHQEMAAKVKKIADQVEAFDPRLAKCADAVNDAMKIVNKLTEKMTEQNRTMLARNVAAGPAPTMRATLHAALTRREVISSGDDGKEVRKWGSTITMSPQVRAEQYGEKLTDWETEAMTCLALLKAIHEFNRALPNNDEYRRDPMAGLKRKAPELYGRMERLSVNWGGDATDGAEWQTTLIGGTWVDHFTLPAQVQAQFMGTNRVNIPDGSEGFWHNVDDTGMTFATISNTAGSMRAHATAGWPASPGQPDSARASHVVALTRGIVNINEEWNQDTANDAVAHARMVLQRDGALAWDEILLNGQVTTDDASHDGSNASDAANGAYNGLRWLCHDTSLTNVHETNGGGVKLSVAAVTSERDTMGKFGVNPRQNVVFVDPVNYLSLVHDDAVKTADVYGSMFTLRTGELASIDGMALIPTDQMPTTMNATGDLATTSTLTGALIVNTTRGFVGQKRGIELRFVPNPMEYQIALAAFLRTSFAPAKADTTDQWIRYIYNLATS